MEVVTVNLVFDDAVTIHMIDRRLWLRYVALSMREEKRINFLMRLEKAEDLIIKLEEHKYDAHERIFRAVRLEHPSDDATVQEYDLSKAVDKYITDMTEKSKEPEIMTVTRHVRTEKNGGGYYRKVKVNKYRKKSKVVTK